MKPKLTIGMAVYDDFNGVYFTVQALRMYHAEAMAQCEIIVVDNNPGSVEGKGVRALIEKVENGRYISFTEHKSTAGPRDLIFREAVGDAVLVIDPHVLLSTGTAKRLIDWYDAEAGMDLFSGPMLYDDLRGRATHFNDQWRDEMWGTWGTDPRGADPAGEPFEIRAMGLGLFTCRRDAWPGFNPNFRGFGGEEFYIHERFRTLDRKCMCLPWLTWGHRFTDQSYNDNSKPIKVRPIPVKYPARRWDMVRNYIIGHTELGIPLDRVYEHFVKGGLVTGEGWAALVAEPSNPPLNPPNGSILGEVVTTTTTVTSKAVTKLVTKPKSSKVQLALACQYRGDMLGFKDCKSCGTNKDGTEAKVRRRVVACQHPTKFGMPVTAEEDCVPCQFRPTEIIPRKNLIGKL